MNAFDTVRRNPIAVATRGLSAAIVWSVFSLALLLNMLWAAPRPHQLKDFGSFVASARAADQGQNPYGDGPLVFHVTMGHLSVDSPNLNPPVSLLLFAPLAHIDPDVAFRAWWALSLGMAALTAVLLSRAFPEARTPARLMWMIGLAGLWHVLELGQIYLPLVLLTIGAWLALRAHKPLRAGLMVGVVVAIKPNLAVWPLLMAAAGGWSFAIAAAGMSAALSLLPLLWYGPAIYRQWLDALPQAAVSMPGNASLASIATRLHVAALGGALAAVLVLGLLVWAYRCRPSFVTVSGVALVTALLASPIAWPGYTLLLLPVLASRPWTPLVRAGAVLLVAPPWLVFSVASASGAGWIVAGSLYGWALLLILAGLTADLRRTTSAVEAPTEMTSLPTAA
jgi:hypothetical protein